MAKGENNGAVPSLTTPAEFRRLREEGQVITLQSTGRVVHWRPVNLTRMLRDGKIPDRLTTYVAERVWEGKADDARTTVDKVIEWGEYLDLVCAASLMFPVISETPAGDEIHPDDLLDEEKLEIEILATNPLRAVRPFRGEQDAVVAVATEGDALPQTTE